MAVQLPSRRRDRVDPATQHEVHKASVAASGLETTGPGVTVSDVLPVSMESIRAWSGASLRRAVVTAIGPLALVLVQALLTVSRIADVRDGVGSRNLEASYHAILTAEALLRTPLSQHWGLPLVSLGAANDKWISWGATVATEHGDYIYTSFPPAGFWLPALAAALRGGEVGVAGLVAVNGVLAAISAVLLYVLISRAVGRAGADVLAARVAGVAGTSIYLFSAEALQSHGAVYWPHSMLQPILLGLLLLLERLLSHPEGRTHRRLLLVALGALTALGCYTEWTAYVFAGLSGLLLLIVPGLRRRAGSAGLVLLGAAASAGTALATHFVAVVGWSGAVQAWQARFLARSGADASLLHLFTGYALSFGGAILAALVILAMASARPPRHGGADAVTGAILIFSVIPVAENLLLLQHATQFTFDRLKFGIALSLVVGLAIGRLSRRGMAVAGLVVCVAAAIGVTAHRTDAALHEAWPDIDRANRALVAQAASVVDLECASIGTDTKVRAYTNLVFDRGVHEGTSAERLGQDAARQGACGTIFVRGEMVFADLPRFVSITVNSGEAAPVTLTAPNP